MLGIDCSARWTNLGLSQEGELLGETHYDLGREQASLLPCLVEALLETFHFSLKDLSAIAVTIGPGYYTGIRVGLAYACALAKALHCPIVPVPTLLAMVLDLLVPFRTFIPIIKAHRKSFYMAAYSLDSGGNPFVLQEPIVATVEWLFSSVSSFHFPCLVGGDAALLSRIPEGVDVLKGRPSPLARNVALYPFLTDATRISPLSVRAFYLLEPDFGKGSIEILK